MFVSVLPVSGSTYGPSVCCSVGFFARGVTVLLGSGYVLGVFFVLLYFWLLVLC